MGASKRRYDDGKEIAKKGVSMMWDEFTRTVKNIAAVAVVGGVAIFALKECSSSKPSNLTSTFKAPSGQNSAPGNSETALTDINPLASNLRPDEILVVQDKTGNDIIIISQLALVGVTVSNETFMGNGIGGAFREKAWGVEMRNQIMNLPAGSSMRINLDDFFAVPVNSKSPQLSLLTPANDDLKNVEAYVVIAKTNFNSMLRGNLNYGCTKIKNIEDDEFHGSTKKPARLYFISNFKNTDAPIITVDLLGNGHDYDISHTLLVDRTIALDDPQ